MSFHIFIQQTTCDVSNIAFGAGHPVVNKADQLFALRELSVHLSVIDNHSATIQGQKWGQHSVGHITQLWGSAGLEGKACARSRITHFAFALTMLKHQPDT